MRLTVQVEVLINSLGIGRWDLMRREAQQRWGRDTRKEQS